MSLPVRLIIFESELLTKNFFQKIEIYNSYAIAITLLNISLSVY